MKWNVDWDRDPSSTDEEEDRRGDDLNRRLVAAGLVVKRDGKFYPTAKGTEVFKQRWQKHQKPSANPIDTPHRTTYRGYTIDSRYDRKEGEWLAWVNPDEHHVFVSKVSKERAVAAAKRNVDLIVDENRIDENPIASDILAFYDGKVVDMGYAASVGPKRQFSLACMRVTDNTRDGYVIDKGKVFYVSRGSRTAKIVTGEARDKVLAAVAAVKQNPLSPAATTALVLAAGAALAIGAYVVLSPKAAAASAPQSIDYKGTTIVITQNGSVFTAKAASPINPSSTVTITGSSADSVLTQMKTRIDNLIAGMSA